MDEGLAENAEWKHTDQGREAYKTLQRLQEKKASVMDIPFAEKLSFRYVDRVHVGHQLPMYGRSSADHHFLAAFQVQEKNIRDRTARRHVSGWLAPHLFIVDSDSIIIRYKDESFPVFSALRL
jgi:hypothetical protein